MNKLVFSLLLLTPAIAIAQPPGYYATAEGQNGQTLRASLRNIIRPHTALTYTPGLWNAYNTTDKKPNGKVWDMYSDIPGGTPAYEYTLVTDQCGSVSPPAEHGCYNREHTWPQSKFSSDTPMQTDLFIVYPTDYFVNGQRGDLPYGKVGTASQTFTNGSKVGNNAYPGAPSGNCFEPIDSFKGDLARTYFYISTCYRNDSGKFSTWEIATLVALKPWAAQMLLEWHHLDPVSKKEVDRNNAVYALQGNRNPFIDRPEFADCIWGTGDCSSSGVGTNTLAQEYLIYPNPASNNFSIEIPGGLLNSQTDIKVVNITGQVLYSVTVNESVTIPCADLPQGNYFINLSTATNSITKRVFVAHTKN